LISSHLDINIKSDLVSILDKLLPTLNSIS